MFKQFPFYCCKDCFCDCYLNDEEILDKHINKELKGIRARNRYERKVILLGNAEAGKSTFLKQMKFIHGRGFPCEEKLRMIPFIYRQIINIVRYIYRAMHLLSIVFEKSQNEEYARLCSSQTCDDISTLSLRIHEAIKSFWSDEGVQLCYHRRREYQLTDSAQYFLDDIDRIFKKDYIPTDDDILRVRVPTMNIVQEDFQFSKIHLQVIDVGGQKTERKKWIHCFDNVTSIIFLASLIEYDQYIFDDPTKQNLMKESLALFRVILSSDYFANASVILFLNKTDLFPQRLLDKPLRCTFPDFDGTDDDVEAAKEFIKKKYISFAPFRGEIKKNYIVSHFTCSIDSKNIEIVFNAVKQQILSCNLVDLTLC